ncbi:MAG: hypothetical protein HXX19_18220 [Rhodoferax sp.]|nr:hypothetical protein [Rhodoferax sp.]
MSVMPTRVSVAHSLKRQARSSGAQRWSLSFRYGQLSRAVMMQFYAFLLSVRGQSDTFTTVLPGHTAPLGSWAGTPLVSGASQTGNSINLQGFTASQTGVAKAGDLLQFSGHTKVYMVTADANSSGTGTATLNIQPALLMSPANLESIVTSYVPFTVALASDNADLGVQAGPLYGLNIDMVEVY